MMNNKEMIEAVGTYLISVVPTMEPGGGRTDTGGAMIGTPTKGCEFTLLLMKLVPPDA